MNIVDFRKRKKWNDGCDRVFGSWQLIDVHEVPAIFAETDEIDFYCYNGKEVYLLRLRNRGQETFSIAPGDKYGRPIYLIAELPIVAIDNEFLEYVLSKFNLDIE